MNQILLGPLLGNNREALIERCVDLVARNESQRFVYLAASQPLLDIVTERILDGSRNRGVWGELPVYLFRGFVRRILSTAVSDEGKGLALRLPIDREELPLKRSLVSQILSRLRATNKLKAIAPLAGSEGCVNSIATLIGEIQRAAKTPEEVAAIIASRASDLDGQPESSNSQITFDNEVALIYSTYCELLQQHHLSEDDADQLRALGALRAFVDGQRVNLPWLGNVEVLILDGFFDFTPVQGEILRELITRLPETLVNLNHDSRNREIFSPYQETIKQLKGIADFEVIQSEDARTTSGALSGLRQRLFNTSALEMSDELQFVAGVEHNNSGEAELERNTPDDSQLDSRQAKPYRTSESDQRQFVVDVEKNKSGEAELVKNIPDDSQLESRQAEAYRTPEEYRTTEIRYFECGDRDTEIRAIAKEIKRLVLLKNFDLADVALVVRQRAAYAPTIARVMHEESVACKLEYRVDANDVPAIRAALKIFELLEQSPTDEKSSYQVSELADLIKSEYFRLGDDDLATLSEQFDEHHSHLLTDDAEPLSIEKAKQLKSRFRIGFWDADSLENAFAYVGSELPVGGWLARAKKLIEELPGATATKELLNIDAGVQDRDADIADQVENAETAQLDKEKVERKRRPSRDIHPATLAWTALVLRRFSELIQAVPRHGEPVELRHGVMRLLDQFGFREQIVEPTRKAADDQELPQVMLNFNALESLRRAFVAAIKSIELTSLMSDLMSDKLQFVADVEKNSSGDSLLESLQADVEGNAPDDIQIESRQAEAYRTTLPIFINEARRSLSSQSQILGPADRSGLRVFEATDVRGLEFKAVFIAGLIEGGFPLRASRDWLYPHEERERLKKYGLTLEDISPATLLKEEHYFYQSACRATEFLYLTRPLVLEDDAETVPSYYLDELQRAIFPLKIEPETVRRDYDGQEIHNVSNTSELSVGLVRQQERHFHSGQRQQLQPQPRIKRLLTLARNDALVTESALRRIEIERQRASKHFGPYDGEITDPHLIALLQKKFGADFVHSASGLSVFGNCAYRFFAQRVLKLEPRGEAALDLQAIDAGKLLHDILRRFFEQHRREALSPLDRSKLREELLEIADKVFDEHERVVPPLNRQIWKIDREIRKILLEQILTYELEIQDKSSGKSVLPAFFEVAFGGTRSAAKDPASTDTPLELTRRTFVGEETIKISGQIDRVDLAEDDTFVAYDYKLSVGATQDDIRSGRSLQIPIYLEALERLILPGNAVAGGGYYIMRGAQSRRNQGLYRASQLEYLTLKAKNSVLSDEDWATLRREVIAKVWEFLDQMREGRFFVNPSQRKETCRFCDFGAVCRYDRGRIEIKKRASTDYTNYTDSDLMS